MWVCQHRLSFLFCYVSPLISFACVDRPLTFVYNTLHYYDRRLQDRAALKRKLVSVIVGTICRKSVFFLSMNTTTTTCSYIYLAYFPKTGCPLVMESHGI